MKKLMGLFLLGIGCFLLSSYSEAAGPTRGAKGSYALNYTATVTAVASAPAALYSVICSSPATAGDYVTIIDSASATGLTAAYNGSKLKTRVFLSSSTTSSSGGKIDYDPPLQFNNGIVAALSTAANSCLLVWESGKVVQGY